MGGVDLHDNAVQNYRIAVRGKKWYFPLFSTCVDSALVNAWKIHCFLSKMEKRKKMSQKDFRVAVTKALLLTDDKQEENEPSDERDDPDYQHRFSQVQNVSPNLNND